MSIKQRKTTLSTNHATRALRVFEDSSSFPGGPDAGHAENAQSWWSEEKTQVFRAHAQGFADPDSIFDYLTFTACRTKFLVCMPPTDWPLRALVSAA